MSTWLLVSGDFTPYGGMDMANFALASYLARRRARACRCPPRRPPGVAGARGSRDHPRRIAGIIHVHHVPRPFGIHRLGEPLLRSTARRVQKQLAAQDLCSLANGGNADLGDLNWVHYVHAAFDPPAVGVGNRLRVARNHKRYVFEEQQALARARLVICNSNRTADDVVKLTGVAQRSNAGHLLRDRFR